MPSLWQSRKEPIALAPAALRVLIAPREALGQGRRFEDDHQGFWCQKIFLVFKGAREGGLEETNGPEVLVFWVILAPLFQLLSQRRCCSHTLGLGKRLHQQQLGRPGLELRMRPTRPQCHSLWTPWGCPAAPTPPAAWCPRLPWTLLPSWQPGTAFCVDPEGNP